MGGFALLVGVEGIQVDVFNQLCQRHGLANEETLALVDLQLVEEVKLLRGFNALGANVEVQRVRHVLNGADDADHLVVLRDLRGEGAVQLNAVEVHGGEQIDVGMTLAEVGQVQADAMLIVD